MTDLRTAAQQALVWIHYTRRAQGIDEPAEERALRAALAEPVEPDPWGAGYEAGYEAGVARRPAQPAQDRLEQLREFCKWERVNSPHPEGLPHVAEWAVREIDRLRAAKAQPVQAPVKRSQDWNDGVIEGHLREREYWLAQQAQPAQDTDCHAQGICQRSGYSIGQRKPLSEKDIERITDEHWPDFVAFTRAVEAAHGIK